MLHSDAGSQRPCSVGVAAVSVMIVAGACGKLERRSRRFARCPPHHRPAAHRVEDRIELTFTVPAANADTTTPAAINGSRSALTSTGHAGADGAQIVADPRT